MTRQNLPYIGNGLRSYWAVITVLFVSLGATFAAYGYVQTQNQRAGQVAFERSSMQLQDSILTTMNAYGQVLRGGVGLLHASDTITRDTWRDYVLTLELGENYPGLQGMSFNAIRSSEAELAAFVAETRAAHWPGFEVVPEGLRDLYVPVLFLEPLNDSNRRAIGFDIYSEDRRRAAVDRAIATGAPNLTAKITLVQEQAGASDAVQAGVLLILPVTAKRGTNDVIGVVVSVFRMGDLVQATVAGLADQSAGLVALTLYDSQTADPDRVLYTSDAQLHAGAAAPRYQFERTVALFGRVWRFETASTPALEARIDRGNAAFTLIGGLLASLLLTGLVAAETRRRRQAETAAIVMQNSRNQISALMGEVNHRSKNLLSLVQAIARQSGGDTVHSFIERFSSRLMALAASQDLLVRNGWAAVSLDDLVRSQLAHFGDLIDGRITVSGPRIALDARAAQAIGMTLHELATNAGKYGALSTDQGQVGIVWQTDQASGFQLTWREEGGPAVTAPTTFGFGSKVTGVMVESTLQGTVQLTYEETGLEWRLACPLDQLNMTPNGYDLSA